uniref:Uncharacterized protein n=1 Tax=Fundulus heteroclitus TaxID=8078 RepID=A0A3Q2PV31_FUNHE
MDPKVSTFIYCMGDEADDILQDQALSNAQRQQYEAVKDTFETYFVPRKNVIYERARYNQRVQQTNETVDSSITSKYIILGSCTPKSKAIYL